MRGVTQFHPPVQLLVTLDARLVLGMLMAMNGLSLDAKTPCGATPSHPYGQIFQRFNSLCVSNEEHQLFLTVVPLSFLQE
ncbi:hypothetical protein D3C75_1173770 [compost metagenome]